MSPSILSTRPVTPGERGTWDDLADRFGCLFDSSRWADVFDGVSRQIGIYDAGGNLRGGFSVWEECKYGLKIWRNPPFTAHVGPFYERRAKNLATKTDEQRAVVNAVAKHLAESDAKVISLGLAADISDVLPFYWRGFKAVPRYTYRIDLEANLEDVFAGFSKERRNDVRRAQKDGIVVEVATETDELRTLVISSFARSDKSLPAQYMDTILDAFPPGEGSLCFVSKLGGAPIAGVFLLYDSRTAYYLMGGYADGAHHGAGTLAMWHAIQRAAEIGLEVFDFEGSVAPAIERYFRGFGGKLSPIMSVNKAWLPLELVLKLRYRNIF